ncbi:Pentatricopeptide repeat-containing protein, mitochondrial [Capsicum baccatum]|uniref:Pentatricopeptide repeat-containing protein, mitochondrial n=1 Tax=Capsicum baccatum TaxID=33114 RepID=A0A2G2XLG9_CAPBA|nr:Pentatricopeptide repeat-containing protein, mitochondrial [Capsicum baccatum]
MLPDSLEWQELLISMGSVEYSGGITEVAQVTRCSDDSLNLYKQTNKKKIADVLLLMEKENIQPTDFTYRIPIDAKGQSNDITGMEQIFETMKADGVEPKMITKSIMAKHYIFAGFVEKTENVLKQMEGDMHLACRYLLSHYAAVKKADDVRRIWIYLLWFSDYQLLRETHPPYVDKFSLAPGSLIVLAHKEKEITNALEGAVNDDEKVVNGGDDDYDDALTAEERMHSKDTGDDSDDSKLVKKFSKLAPEDSKQRPNDNHASSSEVPREAIADGKKIKDKSSKKKKKKTTIGEPKTESEYKKGLRPVLWLTPDFPLKTELLPLLDILANKVKAVRRLRELLTTKLPPGTFPVKVQPQEADIRREESKVDRKAQCFERSLWK